MAPVIIPYLESIKLAYDGIWQLPQFQRDVKWKQKQIRLLFDSLRNDYPIGTFLSAEKNAISNIRPFSGIKNPHQGAEQAELLILDGQQRISGGIQLFYSDITSKNSKYFVDLKKLEELIANHKVAFPEFDIKNKDDIVKFGQDHLEADDGYLVPRQGVDKQAYLFFEDKGLVWTNLLRKDLEKDFYTYRGNYLKKFPKNEWLVDIFSILFRENVTYNPQVPNIVVSAKETKILTRIFTTLNTSGVTLTPFEITVSEMYGKGIDLVDELKKYQDKSIYLSKVDRDRTLLLQACLMFDEKSHKKSLLPKELNKEIWDKNKNKAFNSFEKLSEFLTKELGMGLDSTGNYIPYETAILPLMYVFNHYKETLSFQKQITFDKMIKFYIVASALQTRFTEGANQKQITDKSSIIDAIENIDSSLISKNFDKVFSGLDEVTLNGAKANIIFCIQNANNLRDPYSNKNVNLSDNHHLHHIYPKDFLDKTIGIKENSLVNNIANIMIISTDTNQALKTSSPNDQINLFKSNNGNFESDLKTHFICNDCIEIMKKVSPTIDDYKSFLEKRRANFYSHIDKTFNIKRSIPANVSIEDQDIDPDDEID